MSNRQSETMDPATGKESTMRKGLYALLAAALVILASGCQPSSDGSALSTSTGLESAQEIDLNSPTGGFTATDEAPAFGEAGEFEALADEAAVQDPYESNAGVQNMLRARGARLFEFRAIWGRLAELAGASAADTCPLDWSGTLHLEGGAIIIKKAVAFEPGDSMSRIDRSTISWVSHTGPGVDGIHVMLVVPARPIDSLITPRLELSTGPYSGNFTLADLVALDLVEPVDECGNAISIASVLEPLGCPHGQLMGGWKATPPDTLSSSDSLNVDGVVQGMFRGVWVGAHGLISGYLRGVFGLNAAGERVFFGKYIDTQGHFMGILRGTFGSPGEIALTEGPNGKSKRPHGGFQGEWIDGNVNVQGKLRGHWIASEDGKGLFHGLWGMRCSTNL
jgi:hypothetical protein